VPVLMCCRPTVQNPSQNNRARGHEFNFKFDTVTSELEDRAIVFPFPAGAGGFYLLRSIQDGFGSLLASYSMGIRDSFPGGEAAKV
jgi:hypothetical protein